MNEQRIARARAALDAYTGGDPDDDQATLTDLLTDLRHLCVDEENVNFERAVRSSKNHFEAESGEGDDIEQGYRATMGKEGS